MTVDNFEIINSLLNFDKPNSFYFLQILQRRKENPELPTNSKVIDNYYLYTREDLFKLRDRIIEDCQKYNARAYINVNVLDLEKIGMFTAQKILDLIIKKDFKSIKNAYPSVCGSHHSEENKRWVVDIDTKDIDFVHNVKKEIEKLHSEIKNNKYKILAELPTRQGFHLISHPFRLDKFKDLFSDVTVQKNSPTILYIP
jgi:hypothetical protein